MAIVTLAYRDTLAPSKQCHYRREHLYSRVSLLPLCPAEPLRIEPLRVRVMPGVVVDATDVDVDLVPLPKRPLTNDLRKIFGILDPLPPLVRFLV